MSKLNWCSTLGLCHLAADNSIKLVALFSALGFNSCKYLWNHYHKPRSRKDDHWKLLMLLYSHSFLPPLLCHLLEETVIYFLSLEISLLFIYMWFLVVFLLFCIWLLFVSTVILRFIHVVCINSLHFCYIWYGKGINSRSDGNNATKSSFSRLY